MDDMGVHAQVCYQNSGVTQAGSLMALGDPELALKIVQIYNDASAEYQQVSGQRIFNMAHLPFWDQKVLEAEARRCIDIGLKGFVLPDTPERVGVPSFLSDYWTPFLELCNDTGTPLKVGPKLLLETIGGDNVMFETDFPHPTSLYPGVQEHLKDVMGGYSHEVRKKVLQDNAVKLYNLPI